MTEAVAQPTLLDAAPAAAPAAPESTPSFRDSLPEEYRTDPAFKNFQTPEDIYRSYKHAASMVGMDKSYVIRKPKGDATPEEMNDYYKQLGRPEKPEEYVVPENVKINDKMAASLRSELHALGVPQEHFSGIVKYMAKVADETATESEKEYNERVEQAQQQLKQDFGQAYEQKIAIAREAVNRAGGEPLMELLKETGMINNPTFVKALAQWGEPFRESTSFTGSPQYGGKLTPDEAKMQLNELRMTPAYGEYLAGKNPAMGEKMMKLQEAIYSNVS